MRRPAASVGLPGDVRAALGTGGDHQQVWRPGNGYAVAAYVVVQGRVAGGQLEPLPGRQLDRVKGVPRPTQHASMEGINRSVPDLCVGDRRGVRGGGAGPPLPPVLRGT